MSNIAGKDSAFILGQYNLTPYLNKVTSSNATDKADTSVFGPAKSSVPGQYAAMFGLQGWFDPVAGGYSECISAYMAGPGTGTPTPAILCFPTTGPPALDSAFLLNGWVGTKNMEAAVTGAVPLMSEVNGQGPMDGGVLLTTVAQSFVGTATNSYVDNVAGATTGGWAAILAVHAITGAAPSVVVTLKHCTTFNGVYSTFCTFTTNTAAGFEYKTGTTNPLNEFIEAVVTFGGTTATFVCTIALARR